MSLSPLPSLRSALSSLTSGIESLDVGASEQPPAPGPGPVNALLDFLCVASDSGLQQFYQNIAEEDLVVARLGSGADYVVDKVRSPRGGFIVVKHVMATLEAGSGTQHVSDETSSRLRKVLREIKIATLPALKDCRNLARMLGFGWELTDSSLTVPFLVAEYAEGGTLRSFLRSQSSPLDIGTKTRFVTEAAQGLKALHDHEIAHGDVKLENVLIFESSTGPTLKLSDFGLSTKLGSGDTTLEYWGTSRYRPPEVCSQAGGTESAGLIPTFLYKACDVYTYGLLVLEILIDGQVYWRTASDRETDHHQALERLSAVTDDRVSFLKSLANGCLTSVPNDRPRVSDLLSRLKGNNWGILEADDTSTQLPDWEDYDAVTDLPTLTQAFAVFAGVELQTGSSHLATWTVQETVVHGLRQRTTHQNPKIAAYANFQLAICHYLGFGADRDRKKTLQHLDQAASNGDFKARRIRGRMYEAFGEVMRPIDLTVRGDDVEEQQLRRVAEEELSGEGANPYRIFDNVIQGASSTQVNQAELTLHEAAYFGDVPHLKKLLTHKKDFRDDMGRTALYLAVQGGHLDAIQLLAAEGASNPNQEDLDGHTALHMLIMLNYEEVESALSSMTAQSPKIELNSFASVPLDASEHWAELWGAPLHWAILTANQAMVRALVQAGARIHDWPRDSCPIHIAASLHLPEILEILLKGCPPATPLLKSNPLLALNASNPFQRLLIHGRNYVAKLEQTVDMLVEYFSLFGDPCDSLTDIPLRKILLTNMSDSDNDIAKVLCARGAMDDNYPGLTLLQTAILGCKGSPLASICRMALSLIDAAQNLRVRSEEHRPGWAALHWAAAGGLVSVAEKLLEKDPDSINMRTHDSKQCTALHLAGEAGKSPQMVRLLLSKGADGRLRTAQLELTPLGSFISNQRGTLNSEVLHCLLEASKPYGYLCGTNEEWNVLHYAAARAAMLDVEALSGHLLLRKLSHMPALVELINLPTARGWTALHLASYYVDFTAITVLVKAFSADVTKRTPLPQNCSAFDIVLERARQCPSDLRGAESVTRWTQLSYRSAIFLQNVLEKLEGSYCLTPLHLAAYVGYYGEVVTLVEKDINAVFMENFEGETPRQMLENTLPVGTNAEWMQRFRDTACQICEYLASKEIEAEELLEQEYITSHRVAN